MFPIGTPYRGEDIPTATPYNVIPTAPYDITYRHSLWIRIPTYSTLPTA